LPVEIQAEAESVITRFKPDLAFDLMMEMNDERLHFMLQIKEKISDVPVILATCSISRNRIIVSIDSDTGKNRG